MGDTSIPEGGEASVDQLIDLAQELVRAWFEKEVQEMLGHSLRPGAFEQGWMSACEEMAARLKAVDFADFTVAPHGEG